MDVEETGAAMPPGHWSGGAADRPERPSIVELFARRVTAAPGATAVVEEDRRITYAELDRWSDAVAAGLSRIGVRPGEAVGLLGDRCLEAPVGMLAILKLGAAYVPLDPSDPVLRLRTSMEQVGIRRLVRLPGTEGVLPDVAGVTPAEHRHGDRLSAGGVIGGDPAYVMFTSGSTGVPKAVAVPHRAVVRLVVGAGYLQITADDRVTHTGHPAFDASVFEIWGALLNGARLVIVDQATLLDPARLGTLLAEQAVTVVWLTAGVFHQCARTRPGMFAGLRCLIAGGDVLDPALVRAVLTEGPPGRFLNGYGPTENTTFSTTHHVVDVPDGTARIPIGRPVTGSTCHILDDDGDPAPIGVEGELWVGGDGVALGYVNDPELTAARFVADRFSGRPGARLFRTGDRACWLPGGDIDFLGRRDRMVKVRGFRVELDEIETVLAAVDGVLAAAVVVTGDEAGDRAIVGFVEPAGSGVAVAEVRAALAERLPRHMVPARIIVLDRMPLAGTGKIDRAALAATFVDAARDRPSGRPPGTPIEVGIARLWAEVLDVQPGEVGLDDDFFDLGGNSLLAARLFVRLQTMFGVEPSQSRFLTSRLLADPTLAGSIAAVRQARAGLHDEDSAAMEADLRAVGASAMVIRPRSPADAAAPAVIRRVLLTGGTGFLGGYLLRRLLSVTDAEVCCLVRADGPEHARRRIEAGQQRYRLGDLPAGRVRALTGDLGQPGLGLPEAEFADLTAGTDLILHAGAYVNFIYPYARLAPVTVGGTREIVRLAMPRRIPVHFVSTLAVLAGFGAAGVREVSETTPLAHPEHLFMGYTETKWMAERVLGHAAGAGLPVGVHRPYEISGDLAHGAWNLENATCALLRLIVDTGIAPDADIPLDLVPVDVLAAQIVHIALNRTAETRTYHLTNPHPATLRDMTRVLREHGYPVEEVPWREWVTRVVGFVAGDPRHPFTPFVPLWVDRSPHSGLVVKQMYFAGTFPVFSRDNTLRALAGSGITMPPVDDGLLHHYVRFFQRCGYFPAPAVGVRSGTP